MHGIDHWMHREIMSKGGLPNGIMYCIVVINHKTSWRECWRVNLYITFQCFHKFSYTIFGFTIGNNPGGREATTVVIKNKENIEQKSNSRGSKRRIH